MGLTLLIAVIVGCGEQATRARQGGEMPTTEIGSGSPPDALPEATGAPTAPKGPTGWPAADGAAAAVDTLGEHVKQRLTDFRVISEQIFPLGWIQLRYQPETVTAEVTESDAEGTPRKAVVRIKYQKLSSIIHPTKEAATADDDLLPYPAEETREEMTGRRFARPWPPVDAEIVYELQDGRWVRVDYKTAAVGREGADWLDRIGVP